MRASVINIVAKRSGVLTVFLSVFLSACGGDTSSTVAGNQPNAETSPSVLAQEVATEAAAAPAQRWYTAKHVELGRTVFEANCATCHGEDAAGTANWRERDANGNLPPPPLNGTAHTWHHPVNVLVKQIKNGTPPGMGTMPGFGDKLSDNDIAAVIAWFQSSWPDEIYASWFKTNQQAQTQ